jgi:Tfp pilus assembly protein PilO
MGVVYPFMLLGDVLEWPASIQLALVVLVGVAVLLTDWHQWRADRAQQRRERAIRKRERSSA